MLHNHWQDIHRLLLLCFLENVDTLSVSIQTAKHIDSILSQTQVYLFVLSNQKYTLKQITDEIEANYFSNTLIPYSDYLSLIEPLKHDAFDAALILTTPERSPFSLAYLCYLANIPTRWGQSQEFGGGVLSHCVRPPLEPVPTSMYHLHLLQSLGLPNCEDAIT